MQCHRQPAFPPSRSFSRRSGQALKLRTVVVQNTPHLQTPLNFGSITSALHKAQKAWDHADRHKAGTLTLKETVDLVNCKDLQESVLLFTNVQPRQWTEADLSELFKKADADHSGTLSRTEFLALYLSVISHRVKTNPLVLAEALFGFIDVDRNGRIEGGELKIMLAMLGFPLAMLLPIPKAIGVDYRSILKTFSGGK